MFLSVGRHGRQQVLAVKFTTEVLDVLMLMLEKGVNQMPVMGDGRPAHAGELAPDYAYPI
jgi:predicted transcriptional regulator